MALTLTLDMLDVAIRGVAALPDEPERDWTLHRLLDAYARDKALSLPAGPITKWNALHPIERRWLDRTPFGVTGSGIEPGSHQCSGCGIPLPTEGAFARHYVLSDRRYLNLGNCPIRASNG